MRRRHLLSAAGFGALAAVATGARAATIDAFDPAAFAAAQQAGRRILVDVWASWCPICAKQKPILDSLAADPAFADMLILRVDFDAQKDVLRRFGVQKQSTLVVFHGMAETGRAVGETDPAAIKALLATSKG